MNSKGWLTTKQLAKLAEIEINRKAPPAFEIVAGPYYTRENGVLLRVYPDGRSVRVADPLKKRRKSGGKPSAKR